MKQGVVAGLALVAGWPALLWSGGVAGGFSPLPLACHLVTCHWLANRVRYRPGYPVCKQLGLIQGRRVFSSAVRPAIVLGVVRRRSVFRLCDAAAGMGCDA
eukprot:331530-Pelagomonas_calceolata.AAC.1